MIRQTHTYAILDISHEAYEEIRNKLISLDYGHVIGSEGELDMHGIALQDEKR